MHSFSQLIDDLGGCAALARELCKPFTTVYSWYVRDNIPSDYWPAIKAVARAKRVAGVTNAKLIALNIKARKVA